MGLEEGSLGADDGHDLAAKSARKSVIFFNRDMWTQLQTF
jgi:hypothetical protein